MVHFVKSLNIGNMHCQTNLSVPVVDLEGVGKLRVVRILLIEF